MVAFTQLSSPIDITPAVKSSWETEDVTAHVTNASGVMVRVSYSAATSSDSVGLREKGSTDTDLWSNPNGGGGFYCVGIDINDQLEINVQTGGGVPTVELYGYFDADDVVFFTNPPRYTGGTGSYADVDISSDTGGDTAIGAIIQITNERSSAADFAVRPKGSVTDHYDALDNKAAIGSVIIGVNGSEILEAKRSSSFAGAFVKIMGYVKSGMTFQDDPTDGSLSTTGSYQNISLPVGADSGLYRVRGTADDTWGLRPDAASFDPFDNLGSNCEQSAIVVQGNAGIVEGKIDSTSMDFFLWGYVDEDASGGGGIAILRRRITEGYRT